MISSFIKALFTTTKLATQTQSNSVIRNMKPRTEATEHTEGPTLIRVSKLLTDNAVCSRREAERLLSLGLVRIAGQRVF